MMRGELLVAVVDGQGGGMGRGLVEAVKKKWPSLHVRALGTNSLATAAMLRAGADDGATGENAVDAVSGATATSTAITAGVNRALAIVANLDAADGSVDYVDGEV